jgi:hypothetical protein
MYTKFVEQTCFLNVKDNEIEGLTGLRTDIELKTKRLFSNNLIVVNSYSRIYNLCKFVKAMIKKILTILSPSNI